MSEQNIKIVQQAYAAFQEGNVPAVLDLLSEDIQWRMPKVEGAPYAARYDGRQQVAQFFSALDEGEEVQRFEPTEYIAQNDVVVALGHYAAKVKSTGREFKLEWVQIHTVRDGKISKFRDFYDTAVVAGAYQKTLSV